MGATTTTKIPPYRYTSGDDDDDFDDVHDVVDVDVDDEDF